MENKLNIKTIIIIAIILFILSGLYLVLNNYFNSNKQQYGEFLKNYEVNEYIPVYITDEDMARIYLNDYIYIMHSDIERAYELLNNEYKEKKFGTFENYKLYVSTLNYETYNLNRYYIYDDDGYKIFGAYDDNNNLFIFKTKGVMQYTVYLDDYTVEI